MENVNNRCSKADSNQIHFNSLNDLNANKEQEKVDNQLELVFFQSEFILKEYCLPVSNELKLFLKEDSIILDEKTLNAIDSKTKNLLNFSIKNLESVFIKLNNSSGSDCFFMVNKLRCTKLDEILILLKSSSKLQENLLAEGEVENEKSVNHNDKLYLKKWYKIDMRKEFRVVFYKKNFLVSQRHCDTCFDYELDEIKEIYESIGDFLEDHFAYENFQMEAKVISNNIENNSDNNNKNAELCSNNKNLNYFDFHFIEKTDLLNEIMLIDFLLMSNKKIKIIDVITEKQRNKLAYKLDVYDIKNFLPLVFEKYKKSQTYKTHVEKEDNQPEKKDYKESLDDNSIENENKYFAEYVQQFFTSIKDNKLDDIKECFFYVTKDDEIIERDENYNKFPQELINDPSSMLQFLERLEIQNNKQYN